ncbi:hypothetical protein MJO28_008463 [Puccinia striiformis f. sp. tritici]|uniref:Uncharacterized protein n=1 Tax=Puccinia striiformis f. sp. tritici TaxID=168172 RepID=A0ACC0EB34_9BASI|nr:hypothetical protein MJO28_008463 [Puccinia striiformis f. sp. tritici]
MSKYPHRTRPQQVSLVPNPADQQILALEEELDGNAGIDSDFNRKPPDGYQSISLVDLGKCEEINKLAGDVLDLWQTISQPASPDHPWFSLINSLPPPSIDVTGTENSDLEIVTILNEEDNGSDVDGEVTNATEMMNLLNIANNDH